MRRAHLTSWHFLLILAAVVLYLADRNGPSASQAQSPAPTWHVYFSPLGGATAAIRGALDGAEKSILVQAYSFTSAPIAEALVRARKRGVAVQVILDRSQRTKKFSAADFLINSGIITRFDVAHAIAHNKVMIIDGKTVVTGSFNFTKAAEERNAEDLLVVHDDQLAARYIDNWRFHYAHSEPFSRGTGGNRRLSSPAIRQRTNN
jgi:phosphatidylserine/phosphatidylglycerophosphate/cardiolipin synthase-like enzyme